MNHYVTRNNGKDMYYYAPTEQDAREWAANAGMRNPPNGAKWEIWRADGVKVATVPVPRVTP